MALTGDVLWLKSTSQAMLQTWEDGFQLVYRNVAIPTHLHACILLCWILQFLNDS